MFKNKSANGRNNICGEKIYTMRKSHIPKMSQRILAEKMQIEGVVIFEDKISSLRRFKDDVKEVHEGYECGVGIEKFNDIREGDTLEAFIMEEGAR